MQSKTPVSPQRWARRISSNSVRTGFRENGGSPVRLGLQRLDETPPRKQRIHTMKEEVGVCLDPSRPKTWGAPRLKSGTRTATGEHYWGHKTPLPSEQPFHYKIVIRSCRGRILLLPYRCLVAAFLAGLGGGSYLVEWSCDSASTEKGCFKKALSLMAMLRFNSTLRLCFFFCFLACPV